VRRALIFASRPLRRLHLRYRRWWLDIERTHYQGAQEWNAHEAKFLAAKLAKLEREWQEVAHAELCLDVPSLLRPR
jgi:hypothetical protein